MNKTELVTDLYSDTYSLTCISLGSKLVKTSQADGLAILCKKLIIA